MAREPIRPQDVLPDAEDYKTVKGVRIRKGTIAAALRNIELLGSGSKQERQDALAMIESLAPNLVMLGVHKHFQCRNPQVEAILESAAKRLDDPIRDTTEAASADQRE